MVLVPPMTGGHIALPGEAGGAAPWQLHPMTSSGPCPCPPSASPDNSGEVPDSASQTAHAKPDGKLLDLSFQFISCYGKIMALIMRVVQLSQTKQLVFSRTK